MKIVIVSGGFDPIHSGHISYLKDARKYGDKLIIALNSDEWLIAKKGKFFLPFYERKNILDNLNMVDEVISFEDDDIGSCINGIKKIKKMFPKNEFIFCNGGDRNKDNIPEMHEKEVQFIFGVGGEDKLNSSSWILKNYEFDYENRVWGKFYNLFIDEQVKVKELILFPGRGISYQKHIHRSELWFVSKGKCVVKYSNKSPDEYKEINLSTDSLFQVKKGVWHQVINNSKDTCHIIEIQYGKKRIEEDIIRHSYYKNNDKNN